VSSIELTPDCVKGFPFTEPTVLADPYPYYTACQRDEPALWVQELGAYLITRRRDVLNVLSDEETCSSRTGGRIANGLRHNPRRPSVKAVLSRGCPQAETAPWLDGAEHTRQRAMLRCALTDERVRQLEKPIRRCAEQLVATWPDGGELEFVESFAEPLPIEVMGTALGIDPRDHRKFRLWAEGLASRVGSIATEQQEVAEARKVVQLQRLLASLIAERRVAPREDIISALIQALPDRPPDEASIEIVNLLVMLILAGTVPTQSLLTAVLHVLVTHPQILEQVQADPGLRPRLIEEAARLHSPVRLFPRVTTRAVSIGGTRIEAGAVVLPVFHAANVDCEEIPDAQVLRLDRDHPTAHLAFGHGAHTCVGATLGRAEVTISLEVILENFDRIGLLPGHEPRFEPIVWHCTIGRLPLTVQRQARRR
jgi:cytochrome P450